MDRGEKISVYCYQLNPKYLNKDKIKILVFLNIYLPSSVYILIAKPRGSRTVSAEPLSPAIKNTADIEIIDILLLETYRQLKNASKHVFLFLV
jgi:hypothetical protein